MVAVVLVVGCSAGHSQETLAVDQIDDAITAVEKELGAGTPFYEINATSDGVNLFIGSVDSGSGPSVVQARFTPDNGLVLADEKSPSQGSLFTAEDVDFDPATIIDEAVTQLSSSTPLAFIITASSPMNQEDSSAVVYRLVMESERGGRLVVLLDRNGRILGSDVLE